MEIEGQGLTLVARKSCFGLPTACPVCLPVYIYLKFSRIPFSLEFNLIYPDSDQLPFVEYGYSVVYNNEKGGVIQKLKEDGIIDLDSEVMGIPEWLSMKAMVETWLADAIMYEIWLGSDAKPANKIYFSDIPWPIGKVLFLKQAHIAKQLLGITSGNVESKEEEIYRRAELAYAALSSRLGEQKFFFEDRPTSLDATFLAHVLFTLHALPETSVLKGKLLAHSNLLSYAENLTLEFLDDSTSSATAVLQSDPSSSTSTRGPTYWSSKPKGKTKREKTEEEKKFKRRGKYFLAAQLVAVLVFLSIIGGYNDADVELDEVEDVDY